MYLQVLKWICGQWVYFRDKYTLDKHFSWLSSLKLATWTEGYNILSCLIHHKTGIGLDKWCMPPTTLYYMSGIERGIPQHLFFTLVRFYFLLLLGEVENTNSAQALRQVNMTITVKNCKKIKNYIDRENSLAGDPSRTQTCDYTHYG